MRRIIFSIVILMMLTLAGCSEGDSEEGAKRDPFLGGVNGVTLSFAEGNPPEEVYDGGENPFDVTVVLKNKGETAVDKEDVEVTLSGILPSEFGKSESDLQVQPEEDLIETKKNAEGNVITGPKVFVTFSDLNREDELEGNKEFPIRADVCYLYETRAMADICVKENNVDTTDDDVCRVDERKEVHNSGAPVHATDFKEYPRAEDKVGFSFKVTHVGSGDLYKEETQCSGEVSTDEDKVWVDISTELDGGLSCSGLSEGSDTSGYVRLYDRERQITCTQQVDTQSDYETSVNIKMSYDYEIEKTSNVLVKHATS